MQRDQTQQQQRGNQNSTQHTSNTSADTSALSNKLAKIDLKSSEHCGCLNSKGLEAIKDEFLHSLPSYETLSSYASSIRELVLPELPKEQTQDTDSQNTEVLQSNVISGLSTLGASFLSTAASLVSSVANLKKTIKEKPEDKSAHSKAHSSIETQIKKYKAIEAELLKTNPQEARRLKAETAFIDRALEQLQQQYRDSEQNVCDINRFSQNCPGVSGSTRQQVQSMTDAFQHLHQEHGLGLEELQGFRARLLNAKPEETPAIVAEFLEKLTALQQSINENHQEFSKGVTEIAESSGVGRFIEGVQTLVAHGRELLEHHMHALHDLVDCWYNAERDGWDRGLSLDHYLYNTDSYFASISNQFDLSVMRTIAERQQEQLLSEYFYSDPSTTEESENNSEAVPDGFRVTAWFNNLSRRLIHGRFDADGIQAATEREQREIQAREVKLATGQNPQTDLQGNISAADRIDSLDRISYRKA